MGEEEQELKNLPTPNPTTASVTERFGLLRTFLRYIGFG